MMTEKFDLSTIFKEVSNTLSENKTSLNEADTFNHDHGDHMVQIFNLAQKAVAKKKSASTSEQLAYASQQIRKKATSGSAEVYAAGLENASRKFVGKELTKGSIGTLLESMLGNPQHTNQPESTQSSNLLGSLISGMTGNQTEEIPSTQGGGDFLGSLLSGMMGTPQQPQPTQGGNDLLGSLLSGLGDSQENSQPSGDLLSTLLSGASGSQAPAQANNDLLGSLLSGLSGSQQTQQPSGDLLGSLLSGSQSSSTSSSSGMLGTLLSGLTGNQSQGDGKIDAGDLLSAGLAFFAAKQQGSSNLEAIMQVLRKNSPLGSSDHRTQSGALIINSIMNLLGTKK